LNESQYDILISKLAENNFAQPRWLKLKPAAIYSSIGQKELIRLAIARKIDGFQDLSLKTKPWIFDKESINQYRAKQVEEFNNNENEAIALDIVGSLNI